MNRILSICAGGFKDSDHFIEFISENSRISKHRLTNLSVFLNMTHGRGQFYLKSLFPAMLQLALPLFDSTAQLVFKEFSIFAHYDGDSEFVLKIHRNVIASVLAASFFSVLPGQLVANLPDNCPHLDFINMFVNCKSLHVLSEKLICILNYFEIITSRDDLLEGHLSFLRKRSTSCPSWFSYGEKAFGFSNTICDIDERGKIEDTDYEFEKIDFANAYIGGGVLGNGCVQEEILFLIYPELLVSRLIAPRLSDNECFVVDGARRFSNYAGYAKSFRFIKRLANELFEVSLIIMIDALYFQPGMLHVQTEITNLVRELNKLYIGFSSSCLQNKMIRKISTGNWGCGAFNGNPELKFILQLIVCNYLGISTMRYHTFNNASLKRAKTVISLLQENGITASQVLQMIANEYHDFLLHKNEYCGIFEFLSNHIKYVDGKA